MKWTGRIFCLFCLLAAANFVNSLECAKFELGLSSKALFPDNHFTASSSYRDDYLPHLARYSNNLAAWGAKINDDPNDYLQIDLGRVYKICAVATKGHEKNNEFVDSYKVLYSMDNLNWGTYQETAGEDKVFERNQIHVSNSVKFELNTSVEAKFIRFVPVTVYGHKSMKVELFGELSNVCSEPLGLENGALDRSTFNASSHPDNAHLARLYSPKGWSAAHATQGQYLQIDLMSARTISGVAIQGCEGGWVSNYILQYGMTNSTWSEYKNEQDSDAHRFEGNKDAAQVRVNWFIRQLRARYIRINPTAWHSSICLRAELFGCQESCDQSPLGLEDHSISNSHITSSSKRDQNSPAHHGRLGFTSANAWCAASDDTQPWIQFDLGADHVVCAIATQGDSKSHSWVTSYKVMYSDDAAKWFHYSEAASEKVFAGNFDKSSVVKHQLNEPIRARYIRVSASKHRGSACLRVELYGSSQSVCSRTSGGIRIGGFIPDYNIRATSIYAPAYTGSSGRLNGPFGWAVGPDAGDDEYLEVDFGYPVVLCGMAIQGSGVIKNNEFVKSYKLQVSQDGRDWKFYSPKDDGEEFLIPGSKDRFDTAKHVLQRPVVAKFIRVYPVEFYSHKTMRIDVFGVPQGWRSPVGIESGQTRVASSQITSDDPSFDANLVRLYSGFRWCAEQNADPQSSRYVQVDLQVNHVITGVATRGDTNNWVKTYTLQFALAQDSWFNSTELVKGNSDGTGTAVSWLVRPVVARFVRITPKTSHGKPCFAFDLHGYRNNDTVPPPSVAMTKTGELSASSDTELTCTVYSDPRVKIEWIMKDKPLVPQPTTHYNKGFAISSLQVPYVSTSHVKKLGICSFEDYTRERYICSWEYRCNAFLPHVISCGATGVTGTVHAEIRNKCEQIRRCHGSSTCMPSDTYPEGFYCTCVKMGNHASSGSGADRSRLRPGTSDYCRANHALNKNAEQSSSDVDKPSDAENALDITKTSGDVDNHGCSMTISSDNPWWTVDLGSSYNIKEVVVKRAECCPVSVSIHIGDSSDSGGAGNAQCGTRMELPHGSYAAAYCQPPIDGRYVSVRAHGKDTALALCGVEVYSEFTDFDECTNSTICPDSDRMLCTNTVGSYTCSCDTGLAWDEKKRKCIDVDECMTGTHNCSTTAECLNIVSGYTCTCKTGYHGDGYQCHDVNECQEGLANCGDDTKSQCINTVGSYKCSCNTGYQYQGNERVCKDIDECKSKDDCLQCTNQIGAYKCGNCATGYWRRGWVCEDLDECSFGKYDCPSNMLCKNKIGSYECVCKDGYKRKGSVCVDVNECETVKCPKNHACKNTDGSYTCVCRKGYNLVENEDEKFCVKAFKHSGQASPVMSTLLSHMLVAMVTFVLTMTAY